MRSLDGSPRGDADMAKVKKGLDDKIDVLARRIARLPKPAEAASGGIVDIAKLDSTATYPSFAGLTWLSGQTEAQPYDTTYGAATSMVDGGSVSWLGSGSTPSDIQPTEDGFYSAWCYVTLTWTVAADGPGAAVSIYLNGRDVPAASYFPVFTSGSSAVVAAYVSSGPEWMTTSDYWRVEVQGFNATGADVYASQASWRITKYGAA